MSHPLDGAFAKLRHSRSHLKTLETQIAAAGDYMDTLRFEQEFHPDTSTIEVTLEGIPEVPIEWALLAADCLQNMRCALNYLAWELARLNLARTAANRDPIKTTQFPIRTKRWAWGAKKSTPAWDPKLVQDIDPVHAARIRELQPNAPNHLAGFPEAMLKAGDPEIFTERHPLAYLARVTNDDKHRLLPGVFIGLRDMSSSEETPIDCVVNGAGWLLPPALQNGAKWAEFKITPTGPEPKVHVNDRIGVPEVEFGECGVRSMIPCIGATVESILREFEPVF